MIASRDNLSNEKHVSCITAGSFGDGLEMRGSELDIMYVHKFIEVHENITGDNLNHTKIHFEMMTENTSSCFTMLRSIKHVQGDTHKALQFCEQIGQEKYLSSILFKKCFMTETASTIRGPRLSDTRGLCGIMHSLHCNYWVKPASQWIKRSNNSWPDENTKKCIINAGVLFMPVGSLGAQLEELNWRITFSVSEKYLVYTFSHTQLICLVLMKILLKDVINADPTCKYLLCSYYMKTIIFWISEEIQPSEWTPDNLIPCFMRCFRRLIYCVQYSQCPHYFIPENNMFEKRFQYSERRDLLKNLTSLYSYGWRCIILSDQLYNIQNWPFNVINDLRFTYCEDFHKLLNSLDLRIHCLIFENYNNYRKVVKEIISCCSRKLQYVHIYYMSVICSRISQSITINSEYSNKHKYKLYNTCLSYLLLNLYHDAVSGWLMLASFFYISEQHKNCDKIISYSLTKFTLEKLYRNESLSDMHHEQRSLNNMNIFKRMGIVRMLKFLLLDFVESTLNSTLVPMEIREACESSEIPPLSYLSLLRKFKSENSRHPFGDLKLATAERRSKKTSFGTQFSV
ncbi:Hypothetical predicted protein [Mytilus galloprovincialis]|uniref:Mab-21-like HhH/H2TH-like domain-containing protein n=1 Tax=Mytilus galloprovincialis TaxID=29158 RepID=A0A8B6F8S0_MYTGA|nr:Hypothetical predicted protein [Mytilus galloprovincialis]